MTKIVEINNQYYESPGVGMVIGGVTAGSVVKGSLTLPHNLGAIQLVKKMNKLNSSISADEFVKVDKAVGEVVSKTGLDKKGVGIVKATLENIDEVTKIMTKELDNSLSKYLPKPIKEMIGKVYSSQAKEGKNAFYAVQSKKIVLPEKLSLSAFHEIGHAMNANLSKFGKILQKCRPITILALPISLIALFKTKKASGEESKNGLDKTTTFIKDNAGKLTFATFLPTILEEGLASFRGNKLAKELLSPDVARKVAKSNAYGFISYLSMATLSGLGIFLGTKVKDAIAKKKPIQQVA